MAGSRGIVTQAGISLTGGAAMTVLQMVAAADQKVELIELDFGFNGTVNTNEPVRIQVYRQTTAGTMSAATVVKANDSDGDSFRTTAQHTATVEPTSTDRLRLWRCHPQQGLIYQKHDQAPLIIGAGDRIGFVVLAQDDVDVDVTCCFEE